MIQIFFINTETENDVVHLTTEESTDVNTEETQSHSVDSNIDPFMSSDIAPIEDNGKIKISYFRDKLISGASQDLNDSLSELEEWCDDIKLKSVANAEECSNLSIKRNDKNIYKENSTCDILVPTEENPEHTIKAVGERFLGNLEITDTDRDEAKLPVHGVSDYIGGVMTVETR